MGRIGDYGECGDNMKAWEVRYGGLPDPGEQVTVACPECGVEKSGFVSDGIGHIESVSGREVFVFQYQWPCGECGFKSRVAYVRMR